MWSSSEAVDNPNSGQTDPVNRVDSSPAPRNDCGIDFSDRIYGGQITDLDEFPWMALLGYRTSKFHLIHKNIYIFQHY